MEKGKCKWFKKDYGFIVGADEVDIFVHQSAIEMEGFKKLYTDQLVMFERVQTDKGWKAVRVIPL